MQFETLALAALGWFSLNVVAGDSRVRRRLVERFGEKVCDNALSLARMAALWWLVREYGRAPFRALWHPGPALELVPVLLVPAAFILLAQTLTAPRGVRGPSLGTQPAKGLWRVTSQPFSWAVALWACSHQIVSGDVGSQLFFGAFAVTALNGTRAAGLALPGARSVPECHDLQSQAHDSLESRPHSRSLLRELWLPVLLGLGFSLIAAALHPRIFGTPALRKNADNGQRGANFSERSSPFRNFLLPRRPIETRTKFICARHSYSYG